MPLPQSRSKLDSLIWRALTRYGRIKYRYLLPFYRLFGLAPNQRTASSEPSRTLRGAQVLSRFLSRRGRPWRGVVVALRGGQALSRCLSWSGPRFYREQLDSVIDSVRNSKGAVIFLPGIGWEIVNTQRSHHLAREFARQGYVAIYDSSNAYDDVNGFREIQPNLFLCRVERELLSEVPDPLLWAFTYNFHRKDDYPETTRVVYDWIDDLAVFPFERSFLEANHARALKEASLILTVAHRLHAQALEVRSDALYLPNGVEYSHFANDSIAIPDEPDVAEFLRAGKPVAGYYGAMAEWFDYELLEQVARLRPDWNFLLIGPMYDLSLRERGQSVLKHANVFWIGARAYDSLPAYLRLFDVAIIPFVINNITTATSPLKLYEYFAGGKPVLTTSLPECEAFREVNIAHNAEDFAAKLDDARLQGQDAQFREVLRRLARENSWTARVETVMHHLTGK